MDSKQLKLQNIPLSVGLFGLGNGFKYSLIVAMTLLLSACAEQKEQIKQEFDNQLRSEFVTQCVASATELPHLQAEKIQPYCTCMADKVLATLSANDMATLMGGQADEAIYKKATDAAQKCMDVLK